MQKPHINCKNVRPEKYCHCVRVITNGIPCSCPTQTTTEYIRASADLSGYAQIIDSGIITSIVFPLPLLGSDNMPNSAFFTRPTTTQFKIQQSGKYLIEYNINLRSEQTSDPTFIQVDVVSNSLYRISGLKTFNQMARIDQDKFQMSSRVPYDLLAGTILEITILTQSNLSVIAGTVFSIIKL